jgi:hypothetical protein
MLAQALTHACHCSKWLPHSTHSHSDRSIDPQDTKIPNTQSFNYQTDFYNCILTVIFFSNLQHMHWHNDGNIGPLNMKIKSH